MNKYKDVDVTMGELRAAFVITKIDGKWLYYTAITRGGLPYYGTAYEPTWRRTCRMLCDSNLYQDATPSGRYKIMSVRSDKFRWLPVTFATVNRDHARAIVASLNELEEISDHLERVMDEIAECYG